MISSEHDLLQKYETLTGFEKTLMQFLSILYEPAHITLFMNCLQPLDLQSPRGNKLTGPNLNHYISKFQKLGLVTGEQQCAQEIVEIISKYAIDEGNFEPFANAIRKEAPVSYYYGKWSTRCWRAIRELRIGIYLQNFDIIEEATEFLRQQCRGVTGNSFPPTIQVTTQPFSPEWFRTLPISFQFYLLDRILHYSLKTLTTFPEFFAFFHKEEEFSAYSDDERLPFKRLLFNRLLFRGELRAATAFLEENQEAFSGTGAKGTILFLQDRPDEALTAFNDDIALLRSFSGGDEVALFGPAGLFHILTLLKHERQANGSRIAEQISIATTNFPGSVETASYQQLASVATGQTTPEMLEIDIREREEMHALTLLFTGLCQYWMNSSLQPGLEKILCEYLETARKSGYQLMALGYAEILQSIGCSSAPALDKTIEEIRSGETITSLISIIEPEEPWKRSLQALINATDSSKDKESTLNIRLVWFVEYRKGQIILTPREQKLSANGEWSKGKPLSLARLYDSQKLPYLTLQDRRICRAIVKTTSPETHATSFSLDMEKALPRLIGHPLLFLAKSSSTPVEFVESEPELLVEELGENLKIRFSLQITESAIAVHPETPTRFKIISIKDKHRRIAQITGKNGLIVPKEASEQVLTAIGNISSFMTVHSAIAADATQQNKEDITFVEADSTIYMHLIPYGDGFRLEMFVKPFPQGGHYLKPGQGVENIMTVIAGRRLQTKRNLALEEEKARNIEELCPILDLATDMEQENDREWHLHAPEDCLQALSELQAISDLLVIEWPEGEKLNITHQASFSNMNLKIRTNRQNWFEITGHLTLDQDRVLDLKELLLKVANSSSRFIKLDDGQFLALSQEFRKKLEDLNAFAENTGNQEEDNIILHPLAALPLEDLAARSVTTADAGWKRQLQTVSDAQNYQPEVPSTLQAELRDYQLEGYNWLARLAYLGIGGCLADDMGLGKTLQSLAIILKNAKDGPTMVVAPTSVSTNWQTEVHRFTPTLNLITLPPQNRAEIVRNLGPFDVLITTYTLLQQEMDLLEEIEWQTVILDEAQAIKNAATKRSQAAMAMKARFRLITTGTPIENHLGELWNLFNFINPGLLGSLAHFNEKFASPIERFQDREAKMKLKKLIRPFILRRIKSQVLDELPPRTDITLNVDMTEEEQHFYEALRQNALDVLENNSDKKRRHLQILTEIMRLRQACCNPRLIDAGSTIESSKLKVFGEIVGELIASRHKALVFSQFIGHLQIIRKYLDGKSISYQYLDGGTPAKERKKSVEDFQAGQGDLFLISLKAGGLGLNLTAADYVIHMDPWWNPAIEDQASDRAHRIGQTRPVTIYRLVCKNTIEEKIVRLHQEKRGLAGSLLEGTDISAKMSSGDLFDLIRQE